MFAQLAKLIYDVLQILDRNLTHKILLPDLFEKSKIKNFKELIGSDEPNLFNYVKFIVDISVFDNF
jgi:hypothetical protein